MIVEQKVSFYVNLIMYHFVNLIHFHLELRKSCQTGTALKQEKLLCLVKQSRESNSFNLADACNTSFSS